MSNETADRQAAFDQLHEAARGHYDCVIVDKWQVLSGLLLEFDEAQQQGRLIARWLAAVHELKPGSGPLCLACEFEFTSKHLPALFFIMTPFASEPVTGVVTGICQRCSVCDARELEQAALKMVREVYPDAQMNELGAAS